LFYLHTIGWTIQFKLWLGKDLCWHENEIVKRHFIVLPSHLYPNNFEYVLKLNQNYVFIVGLKYKFHFL
jgi:hypothetical protein